MYKFRKFNFDFVKADLIKEGQLTKVPTHLKNKRNWLKSLDNSITRIDCKQIDNPLNNKDFYGLLD